MGKDIVSGKKAPAHRSDLYGAIWNTFAACSYKKVYKNEWLGGIHYRMGFAWKVNFLLNKYTEKALESLKTLETYKSIPETERRATISPG